MKIPAGIKNNIEELYKLRQEIKTLKSAEEELSSEIKDFMQKNKIEAIESKDAYAEICMRPYPTVDPESYYEALGGDFDKFVATITVRVDEDKRNDRPGARNYLGTEELDKISTTKEVPVLYVKRLGKKQKSKPSLKYATN